MTYDYELTLIGDKETTILCGKKSVGRNEFYSAAQAGLKPEIIFIVHDYEYNGEEKIRFEGKIYKVIKTYSVSFEEVELTCSMLRR